jgi:hypothetical protein
MKIAIGIINRNLPKLTNDLVERIQHLGDVFVLENGSDEDKYSKYANIKIKESNGLPWGVNYLIDHCFKKGYDYVWINYNDVYVDDPDGFVNWSLQEMEQNNDVGITIVNWGSIWNMNAEKCPNNWWKNKGNIKFRMVSFFDDLSFIVSKHAIDVISSYSERLTPFFDSSNYPNHYGVLAPSIALYSSNMKITMNTNFSAREIRAPAETNSILARGFKDSVWKHDFGPMHMEKWLNSFFPELKPHVLNNKQKRDLIINQICYIYEHNKM